jgi:hypothetical protein
MENEKVQNRKGLTLETVFLTQVCPLARDLTGIFPHFCGLFSLLLFPLGGMQRGSFEAVSKEGREIVRNTFNPSWYLVQWRTKIACLGRNPSCERW